MGWGGGHALREATGTNSSQPATLYQAPSGDKSGRASAGGDGQQGVVSVLGLPRLNLEFLAAARRVDKQVSLSSTFVPVKRVESTNRSLSQVLLYQ